MFYYQKVFWNFFRKCQNLFVKAASTVGIVILDSRSSISIWVNKYFTISLNQRVIKNSNWKSRNFLVFFRLKANSGRNFVNDKKYPCLNRFAKTDHSNHCQYILCNNTRTQRLPYKLWLKVYTIRLIIGSLTFYFGISRSNLKIMSAAKILKHKQSFYHGKMRHLCYQRKIHQTDYES